MAGGKKSNRLPPFVALIWEMLNSIAYKDISYSSAKALPFFLGKYKGQYRDPGRYQFQFYFPYSEAKRYGFPTATFSKVIQELIRKGFIDPVDKGGLRSDGRSYNFFRLSRRWEKYGSCDFVQMDWKCFVPRSKTKTTSKSDMYSFKNGKKKAYGTGDVLQIEAVAGVSE